MENVKMFFACASVFVMSIFFVFTVYWCVAREQLGESRLNALINAEAIKGNKAALSLIKRKYGTCRYKDRHLVHAALEGNEYAMDALGILEDKKEKKE